MQNKKALLKNNRAEKSISSAGSQDTQNTCDLCPNTADKLWYMRSFDTFIVAHLPAFVNTKMQIKSPAEKSRAKTSILSAGSSRITAEK